MKMSEFEKILGEAVADLPEFFRAKLDNVVITAQFAPPAHLGGRSNTRLLGIYEGVPLDQRGTHYSGALPDRITLFKRNLELDCEDPAEMRASIGHTLRHEIAHHFGISDEELLRKGLY